MLKEERMPTGRLQDHQPQLVTTLTKELKPKHSTARAGFQYHARIGFQPIMTP